MLEQVDALLTESQYTYYDDGEWYVVINTDSYGDEYWLPIIPAKIKHFKKTSKKHSVLNYSTNMKQLYNNPVVLKTFHSDTRKNRYKESFRNFSALKKRKTI